MGSKLHPIARLTILCVLAAAALSLRLVPDNVFAEAGFGFALSVALGFAAGCFSAVLIPWIVLTGWAAYNVATAAPSAVNPDAFPGAALVAALAACAGTGVLLGVAVRMALATRSGSGAA